MSRRSSVDLAPSDCRLKELKFREIVARMMLASVESSFIFDGLDLEISRSISRTFGSLFRSPTAACAEGERRTENRDRVAGSEGKFSVGRRRRLETAQLHLD